MTNRREAGRDPLVVPGTRVRSARTYPGDDPAAHAGRLLGRAVNADRPGEGTLQRLAAAGGYAIERLPDPRGQGGGRGWIALYEHAFLLADDTELCLYELEHDHAPDGGLVSEVHADEAAAALAARRLGRPGPAGRPVPPDLGTWRRGGPYSVERDG
ncbi:DUF6227 family protein [Streptomyces sp. MP131-18]|uniref:DUF6227 family protein n=1 Tax=Streptomyces sp. MP131-18 TaxID=1857892 RepID=UPI00097BB50F|nr:DUF6227 family protein [Streptomyces sp. MP131-18]ONK10939.1 hypothetical protein STBA_16640 [Streptomyces sp. MP131-18]